MSMVSIFKPEKHGKINPDHCKAAVMYYVGNWPHHKQCDFKHSEDGWCKIHHPDAVKNREAKKEQKWKREQSDRTKQWEKEDAARDLVNAVAALTPASKHHNPGIGAGQLNTLINLARVAKGMEPLS